MRVDVDASDAQKQMGAIVVDNLKSAGIPAKIREHAMPEHHVQWAVRMYADNGKRYRSELRRID